MPKTTVYVETTIIGHLKGRVVGNPIIAGRQLITREWWPIAIERHQLFVSVLVADEAGGGDPEAAAERLDVVNTLEFLDISAESDSLATQLMICHAIPETEPRDAAHVAIAAVHGIKYLVTWNFTHIANPTTRGKIEQVCRAAGFEPPIICTPDELMEA